MCCDFQKKVSPFLEIKVRKVLLWNRPGTSLYTKSCRVWSSLKDKKKTHKITNQQARRQGEPVHTPSLVGYGTALKIKINRQEDKDILNSSVPHPAYNKTRKLKLSSTSLYNNSTPVDLMSWFQDKRNQVWGTLTF